jgi:arginine/serine-rich splicing factor 18
MFTDAAKRRQLPAWIREGLEKMEREKQKKIDRERQIKEREAYLQKKREEEENAISELEKNSSQPAIPKKSKFVSILTWVFTFGKQKCIR